MNTMFEHSVKVPRHYKVAANIFKKAYTEGGSVKTLLYDEKLRHFRTNVLYALITETIKHAVDIDKIFESCQILVKEPRLDPWLAKVLAVELLYGKKALPGKSKPEQTILSYKEQFEQNIPAGQDELKTKVVRRPRYVRVNTNLLATSDATRAFQDEGYKFIRCTSGTYDDYLKQIQSLTEYDFTQDYHVKTMFVFAPGTKLHEHDLYLENQIILQDKATALAVHLLAPPPGSVVLDMCAAPGMKTTQLAAYLRNQGKVYAVERNETRYKTLCDFVEKTGSKCVETLHKDSLEIKRGDYDDVEYILLDPSCSGSGMDLQVHNYIEDTRLARLTSLQEKFLKHAMNSFPNAKRIVYSTCSLYPEENERVITNIVKASRAKWRVQDVKELLKGQWNNFGSGMYGSIGTRCLYAVPDSDFTTGFFLAVLDRDPKDFEKSKENCDENLNGEVENKRKRKSDYNNADKESKDTGNEGSNDSDANVNKNRKNISNVSEEIITEVDVEEEVREKRKKKKKNMENNELKNEVKNNLIENEISETENSNDRRKKKKKRKTKEESLIDVTMEENREEVKKSKDEYMSNADHGDTNGSTGNREKKKKKRKTEEESLTDITTEEITNHKDETVSDGHLANTDDLVSVSSKKKKKKNKVNEDSSDFTAIVESPTENVEQESNLDENEGTKKKKKKKDKTGDFNNSSLSVDLSSEYLEVTNERSKKKNKSKENTDENLNSEEVTVNSSKKKKHKQINIENSIDNELNDEVPKKKKHKKM